jgi:hypothetical protein
MRELVGDATALPDHLRARYPELSDGRYRRGGLPLRIGGWFLGQSTVAGITLGRTIFLAESTLMDAELLLHEVRHVQQFSERRTFPFRYIWESLRHGYHANCYESDARSYAARRVSRNTGPGSDEDA